MYLNIVRYKYHIKSMIQKYTKVAEREGIEPTKDHNSLSTVLKTAVATRHTALSLSCKDSMVNRAFVK